jgi:hypothetical protein
MSKRAHVARLLLLYLYLLNIADGVLTFKLTKMFGPEGELNPIWAPLLKSGNLIWFLVLKILIGSIAILWLYARIGKIPERFSKVAFCIVLMMAVLYTALVGAMATQLW